eukprot:3199188-Pleurochrysis_carterae.AAC.1
MDALVRARDMSITHAQSGDAPPPAPTIAPADGVRLDQQTSPPSDIDASLSRRSLLPAAPAGDLSAAPSDARRCASPPNENVSARRSHQ